MEKAKWTNYLAVLLLLLMFAQLQGNASPTADEQEGIVRGYAWVTEGHTLAGKTPLLSHALAALPLRILPDLNLPGDDDDGERHLAWTSGNTQAVGDLFLWRLNPNAEQILFLARLPNVALALLLAAFVHRWARDLYGSFAGVLALLLCTLDPNLLAHGRLATADLGVTVFLLISTCCLWRFLRWPTIVHLFAVGVFLGLAMATKFSALLFVPLLALLMILRAWKNQPFRLSFRLPLVASNPGETVSGKLAWLVASGLWIGLIAVLTVWVVYGFQVDNLPGTQFPVLAPDYFVQLKNAPSPFQPDDDGAHFLRGELYTGRRWPYLLITFLLKTPLPTFALIVASILISFKGRTWRNERQVLWPPIFFLCLSLTSQVNSGYHYILPIVPFMLIYASRVAAVITRWIRGEGAFAGSLPTFGLFFAVLGWYVFGTIGIYPHYLAYFNEIAGGAENGWRNLIGDDLDRGQDLGGLKTWMEQHHVEKIKLAYQGVADPAFYGIAFDALPGPRDSWGTRHLFYPYEPAPGIYAISVNSLQGLQLSNPDTYVWFRQRRPMAKIGYSIFIYEVPRTSSSQATACISGLQPADILPEDYKALFKTNDVKLKWFNVDWAFPFPARERTHCYYLIANDKPIPQWNDLVPWSPLQKTFHQSRQGIPYSVTEVTLSASEIAGKVLAYNSAVPVWWSPAITFLPGDPAAHAEQLALPVNFGHRVELLGYTIDKNEIKPGEMCQLTTWWRVLRTDPSPLKIFAHLIDHQSELHGGEDRLDVLTEGWEADDVFVQVHRVLLSADTLPGTHQVEIGWYDAHTIQRLEVLVNGIAVADRVLLTPVEVVE